MGRESKSVAKGNPRIEMTLTPTLERLKSEMLQDSTDMLTKCFSLGKLLPAPLALGVKSI